MLNTNPSGAWDASYAIAALAHKTPTDFGWDSASSFDRSAFDLVAGRDY
jgi:hypothetical protein